MVIIKWILDPKNRSLLAFLLAVVAVLFFVKQCNSIQSLKDEVEAKDQEILRNENNYLASIDTIKQSYDKTTGTLTASVKGYDLTLKELNTKYSKLFTGIESLKKEWKNSAPTTIIEKHFTISEKITGVNVNSMIDNSGNGNIAFVADTIFNKGNSRKITANIPYTLNIFNKNDSMLLKYTEQPFFVKTVTSTATIDFQQSMTVYTGLLKDKKTGAITTWAKTDYPGVTFNVLKGANIEDDKATKEALISARKQWGLGTSIGGRLVYSNGNLFPGVYIGIGLNYTPRKLQFGK